MIIELIFVAIAIYEVYADNGHLSWKREYHLVLLGGLDCPAHFSDTDTTYTSFLLRQSFDRAAFCGSRGLASQTVELAPLQFDFLFRVLFSQKVLNLGAEYEYRFFATRDNWQTTLNPA